jgi:hypothetical protein
MYESSLDYILNTRDELDSINVQAIARVPGFVFLYKPEGAARLRGRSSASAALRK